MTTPSRPAGPPSNASPAAPQNPRVQAVDFALKLAALRSRPGPNEANVTQLISDAEVIFGFIGKKNS